MTVLKENPTKCSLCGSEEQPINVMNPNTSGYPTKRVDLCAVCVAKNPEATFVSGPGIAPPQDTESVPAIDPAVGSDPNVVETKEFAPKLQDLNVVPPDPKVEPLLPKAPMPDPPGDLGPVPPDVIKQQLDKHEKDHDALLGKRRQLQNQLAQVAELMSQKRGAIATLRGLLGDAS